jgi:hypothetical protein
VVFDVEEQEFGTQAFFGQESEAEQAHPDFRDCAHGAPRNPQFSRPQLAAEKTWDENQVMSR